MASLIPLGSLVLIKSPRLPEDTFGSVRFVGLVEGTAAQWVGIELELPLGTNDGTANVNGRRYFECKSKYGLFVRPWLVEVLEKENIDNAASEKLKGISATEISAYILTKCRDLNFLDQVAASVKSRQKQLKARRDKREGNTLLRESIKQKQLFQGIQRLQEAFLKSEKEYFENLSLVHNLYIKGFEKDNVLEKKVAQELFGNFDTIKELSQHMLEELTAETESVGFVLQRYAPHFQLYRVYIENLNGVALPRLRALESGSTQVSIALQEYCKNVITSGGTRGLELASLLAMPVERLPCYVQLTRDLLKLYKKIPSTVKGTYAEMEALATSSRRISSVAIVSGLASPSKLIRSFSTTVPKHPKSPKASTPRNLGFKSPRKTPRKSAKKTVSTPPPCPKVKSVEKVLIPSQKDKRAISPKKHIVNSNTSKSNVRTIPSPKRIFTMKAPKGATKTLGIPKAVKTASNSPLKGAHVYQATSTTTSFAGGKVGSKKVKKKKPREKKFETAVKLLKRTTKQSGKNRTPDKLIIKAYGSDVIKSAARKANKQARPMPKSHKRKLKAKSKGQKRGLKKYHERMQQAKVLEELRRKQNVRL